MYETSTSTKPRQHKKHAGADCCTDAVCDSGLRNNYFEGKRLTAESFRVEQRYLLERRRLLNRAIHGWGVVYGYAVTLENDTLKIGAGLALDECGRELEETGYEIAIGEVIVIDDHYRRVDSKTAFETHAKADTKRCWLLCAHYAERLVESVTAKEGCHCEHE